MPLWGAFAVRRLGLVLACLLVGTLGTVPSATALNTYPQVNSKTLQSGRDTLEWGDRYQINVCDSHHAWPSMTLWVRASKSSAWQKVGRTTKVSDTRTWPQSPAKCRWFAPFEWTVNLPDRGFGTLQFGYGRTKPEYTFRGIVRNESDPTPVAPAEPSASPSPTATPSRQPSPPTGTVTTLADISELGSTANALEYGKNVWITTCTPDPRSTPLLYAKSGNGNWTMVNKGSIVNNPGTVCDVRGGYGVLWNWTVDAKGTLDTKKFPYPLLTLGTAFPTDGTVPAAPTREVVNAIVWPDRQSCQAAGYSNC